MGFIIANVIKWESSRDSKNHVSLAEHLPGREILLNCNRMSEVTAKGSDTSFYYNENPNDPKDGRSYIEIYNHSTTVLTAIAVAYPAEYRILPIYRDNNPAKATTNTAIRSADIVYADRNNNLETQSWVVFIDAKGSRKRVLVNSAIDAIYGTYLLRDYDNNTYRTVNIGTQKWTVQNLRTTHYGNGVAIPKITNNTLWKADVTGAYCWYENNDGFKEEYGALYNWHAVNNANGLAYFKRNGVQEAGWRVPALADYATLVATLGGEVVAGGKLKEKGYEHWFNPNEDATDTYGFRARGTGGVSAVNDDDFDDMRVWDDSWTSEEVNAARANSVYNSYYSSVFYYYTSFYKYAGLAVRCMRDV